VSRKLDASADDVTFPRNGNRNLDNVGDDNKWSERSVGSNISRLRFRDWTLGITIETITMRKRRNSAKQRLMAKSTGNYSMVSGATLGAKHSWAVKALKGAVWH